MRVRLTNIPYMGSNSSTTSGFWSVFAKCQLEHGSIQPFWDGHPESPSAVSSQSRYIGVTRSWTGM